MMDTGSRAGVGFSKHGDAFVAGAEAASMAQQQTGTLPPLVVIAYASVLYEQQEVLRGIRSIVAQAPIVGGSAQGISWKDSVDESDRIVGVALLCSSTILARVAQVQGIARDPIGAGRSIAEQIGRLAVDEDRPPLLMWYDPLTGVNMEALLDSLAQQGLEKVIGGGASQPWGPMHKTWQYFNEQATHDSAVALQLQGCSSVFEVTHGTEPLGLQLTVTEARDNILTRIDGQPALDIWKEQVGIGAMGQVSSFSTDDTSAWAIGVTLPEDLTAAYEGPITRAVFGFNEETGEVILQAPISPGTKVQLCHRTPPAVFDRAVEMARRLERRLADKEPLLALAFECGARARPFLGDEQAMREVQQVQAIIGVTIPWLGVYAWGEIAPVGPRSFFHNYTFPLCIICR